MGFSPHRTEIDHFKIPPTAFSEQTANISAYTVYTKFYGENYTKIYTEVLV